MEKLGQKGFTGHKCNLCFCSGYQKSAGTDSETLGNSQSRQDIEERTLMQGPEDLSNQEAPVKLHIVHRRRTSTHGAWVSFWKTESSFRHQN